ncbi:MAG: zinc ribbon domain-containing protein [Candidatus Lokiarchaeota archaeon]|nr:zinc ribbon domain-containing protein [Candidatus Lokiarchaeota archaeon]
MNENLNSQKNCPVCGKENKLESKFCKFCGGDMVASDFQPFEISQTMIFRIGCYSSCCIIFMVLLVYFSLVVLPEFDGPIPAITAGLLLPLLGGVSVIALIYLLVIYRNAGSRRIFSISPKSIKIVVPKEPICEAEWSKFDNIEVEKLAGDHNSTNYRFYFTSHGVVYREVLIRGSMDFSGINCRTIVSRLQHYAEKMNKQFIGGKRRKI